MLKYGGDMVEWMLLICEQAWKKGEVRDDWKKYHCIRARAVGVSVAAIGG